MLENIEPQLVGKMFYKLVQELNYRNVHIAYHSIYNQHICLILNNIIFAYLSPDNMINYLLVQIQSYRNQLLKYNGSQQILIFCLNDKLKYFGKMSFDDLNTGFFPASILRKRPVFKNPTFRFDCL